MADQKEHHHTSKTVNMSLSQTEVGWIQDRKKVSKAKPYSTQPDKEQNYSSQRVEEPIRIIQGPQGSIFNKILQENCRLTAPWDSNLAISMLILEWEYNTRIHRHTEKPASDSR